MRKPASSFILLTLVFLLGTGFPSLNSILDPHAGTAFAVKNDNPGKDEENKEKGKDEENKEKGKDEENKEKGKDEENKEKLVLTTVAEAPDPFSPAAHGTAVFQANFEARETDALGTQSDETGKQFFIQYAIRIAAVTGAEVVILEGETQVIPPQGKAQAIPIVVEQAWDGRDAAGNFVADGSYTYEIRGSLVRVDSKEGKGKKEKADNIKIVDTSNTLASEIAVDGTPPVVSDLLPADGGILGTATPTLSGSYADNLTGIDIARIAILLDGVDVTAQATLTETGFSLESAPLADGSHTVVVSVRDVAGNQAQVTSSFLTDITPPVFSGASPEDGSNVSSQRPPISASYSDLTSGIDLSTVRLTVDNVEVTAAAQVTATDVSWTPAADLPEGAHAVTVDVQDQAGNPAPQLAFSFTVDVTPPQITALSPADDQILGLETPILSASYADNLSGIDVASVAILLDGSDLTAQAAISATGFSLDLVSPLADGSHMLSVSAKDGAGNQASDETRFITDITPPVIAPFVPAAGQLLSDPRPTINAAFEDLTSGIDISSVYLRLDAADVTGQADITETSLTFTPAADLADGTHAIELQLADRAGKLVVQTAAITVDATPPVVAILSPEEGATLDDPRPALSASFEDATSAIDPSSVLLTLDEVDVTGQAQITETSITFIPAADLSDGFHTLQLQVADQAGNPAGAQRSFTVQTDAAPPVIAIASPEDGAVLDDPLPTVSATYEDAQSGIDVASVVLVLDGLDITDQADVTEIGLTFVPATELDGGIHTLQLQVADRAGNLAARQTSFTLQLGPALPPDPAEVAPPVDEGVATSVFASTQFLYAGSDPVQTGVEEGAIELRRAAVVRGQVQDRGGQSLSGVAVTILDHPEFGQTLTREDGMFDLALNGGGPLTVSYAKDGYLPAQRQVQVPWQDFALAPTVVLIPADPQVTPIDLSAAEMQVAQGSEVTDGDGTRQATLLFPQGTSAIMVWPDGTTQSLSSLQVRATEYTVGENGPEAMPAELPHGTGYTYCVEFSVDEALAAGAADVRFSQPVVHYVENFLGFPVGGIVPTGYYDRQRGQWIPSDNGRVVRILGVTDGLADLDISGSGAAADQDALAGLGVADNERAQLAALYSPGQSLWRVPIKHFTPWDCNWPVVPPVDAVEPKLAPPATQPRDDDPCECSGSVIECQNQVLGEVVPIAGTPFALHYRSDRVPGRLANNTLQISLTGATALPASLIDIHRTVSVAGQWYGEKDIAVQQNLGEDFVWDGKDAYGRFVQGRQQALISVGYEYGAKYATPAQFAQAFGRFSGGVLRSGRSKILLTQSWIKRIGSWDARIMGLGGWTLNVHHAYDPIDRKLYFGNGSTRSAESLGQVIATAVGSSPGFSGDGGPATQAKIAYPYGVAIGMDGSLYIADYGNHRVRKVSPDGTISTVAGTGGRGFSGDGGPATQAQLDFPWDVAVGPDGSIYISDYGNVRVRRVSPDGIITTVAGRGCYRIYYGNCRVISSGDGGPATSAFFGRVGGIDVDSDGNLYIAEWDAHCVRRVGTDGVVTKVAGDCGIDNIYNPTHRGFSGDGGPAAQSKMWTPQDVALGPDGSLYIADTRNNRIRKVTPDGIINTVAGGGNPPVGNGDGGPATQAKLFGPQGITVGPDGSIYIAEYSPHRIRRVSPEGIINTVVGTGENGFSGDGGPAPRAKLNFPNDVALSPDGTLYIADTSNQRIRKIEPAMPGLSAADILIPSSDGSEVYRFTGDGRHVETLDALLGIPIYRFSYDSEGRLVQVVDRDGDITTIERDPDGLPTAFVSPYGHRSTLALNEDGYLTAITNPASESIQLSYDSEKEGLLATFADPKGNVSRFFYDELGRLTRDEDPVGGFTELTRTDLYNGYEIKLSTATGRETTYQVEHLSTDGTRKVNANSCCSPTEILTSPGGDRTSSLGNGSTTALSLKPAPRFGMQAPLAKSRSVRTPEGLLATLSVNRSISLANPDDPFSVAGMTQTETLNGRTYTSSYNSAQKKITITTPAGRQIAKLLDDQGRMIEQQIPGLASIQLNHDIRGRLVNFTQGTRSTSYIYDAQGNLSSIINPLSLTVSFEHDPVGRVTKQTLADGRSIFFSYDSNGNILSITPPGRPNHTFTYTPGDLVEDYEPPALGMGDWQTRYTYNLNQQILRITRPDGGTIDFEYDAAGRRDKIILPRGIMSYDYDPSSGNLTGVTAPDGNIVTYNYDGFLPLSTTWTGSISGSVNRVYNSDFNVISRSVNGASPVDFQYDADGLLIQAGQLNLIRDPQNGLISGTEMGDFSEVFSHNSFGEIDGYRAKYDGLDLFLVEYGYDDLGRIIQKTETIEGEAHTFDYAYDTAGRLTEVRKDGVLSSQYTYDSNSNRLSHVSADGTLNGVYDDQDRLVSYGDAFYAYTDNGDLISKTIDGQTTQYVYDVLGNLINVTLPNGTRIDYIIDGIHRRIGRRVDGTLVQGFIYKDILNPIAEVDADGNIVAQFVYATRGTMPDYMIKDDVNYWIISDHLGSPRLVVDTTTGDIVQRMDYDEFGNVVTDSNPGFQPFGFGGGIYDSDIQLTRLGARDYDARTGRWTIKDPILFGGRVVNLYAYVSNDPVNWTDPLGLGTRVITEGKSQAKATIYENYWGPWCGDCVLGDLKLEKWEKIGHIKTQGHVVEEATVPENWDPDGNELVKVKAKDEFKTTVVEEPDSPPAPDPTPESQPPTIPQDVIPAETPTPPSIKFMTPPKTPAKKIIEDTTDDCQCP